MFRKAIITSLVVLTAALAFFSCSDKKIVEVEVPYYLLYRDILGNAEFEADGNYPPPDNQDNFRDGEITVTLRFGEALDIFEKDEVYGYMITVDSNPVNYHFKFVPDGKYWLEAEFVVVDSCFSDESVVFQHSDTVDTVVDLHPTFLGTNMGCFDLILTGVSEGEFVQVEDSFWVTGKVYEHFYRDRKEIEGVKP